MANIATDYKELEKFSKALEEFASDIDYQMSKLLRETEGITSYSWRGRQAESFLELVSDTKKSLDKNIEELKDLSDAVFGKAQDLKKASERKFG